MKKLDVSEYLDGGPRSEEQDKWLRERKDAEQELFQSLNLRSYLEGVALLRDPSESITDQMPTFDLQQNYVHQHMKLALLEQQCSALSRRKVSFLSCTVVYIML